MDKHQTIGNGTIGRERNGGGLKRLSCLLLAAGLAFGAAFGATGEAGAVEFKAKGVWLASFQYGQHGNFNGKGSGYDTSEDEFEARSRVRLQLDAKASENLMGEVYFEIGKSIWGKANNPQGGMALGGDGTIVKVKRAFIDWAIPNTSIKVRMGLQGFGLPYMAMDGPTVFQSDVAAVTVNWTINDNVGLTAFWARPYNDNYVGDAEHNANFMDNMDMGGIVIPLHFEGINVTPWGMYAAIGPNTYRDDKGHPFGAGINGVDGNYSRSGLLPLGANLSSRSARASGARPTSYGNAWWGGLSGEIEMWNPFRIAWDFMYGSVRWDDSSLTREGWMGALTLEYAWDWGTLGIYGWYSSGDNSNMGDGSERLPTIANDYGVASFSGTFIGPDINGLERDRVIGNNLVGTWGAGFRLKNVSFLENLKHTFHVSLMGGTNDPGIIEEYEKHTGSKLSPYKLGAQTSDVIGRENVYMTTRDYALELGLLNEIEIYENLKLNVEASYVKLWLDKSDDVWGPVLRGQEVNDAWNISMLFIYSF